MRILIVDNYDSFVYNIVGLLKQCRAGAFPGLEWDVALNDAVPFGDLGLYDAVIISPGPGVPSEAGDLMRLMSVVGKDVSVLGVCLGCQAIAMHYGASLCQLAYPRHGHPSPLRDIDASDPVVGSLAGKEVTVGRYHSWVVDEADFPSSLVVTSRDEEGHIMSFRHRSLPLFGVQFHPESIITDCGVELLRNFMTAVGNHVPSSCPFDYPGSPYAL